MVSPPQIESSGDSVCFEPAPIKTQYHPPKVCIDRDRSKGWVRRLLPVPLAHKGELFIGLSGALVSLVLQVTIPRVTMQAIDKALIEKTASLQLFIWLLLALTVGRSLAVFFYRNFLFKVAALIEFDLRALFFDHISKLSFSFFDRVQSGQLISRANSDIRTIQMFLIFSPFMLISTFSLILAIILMLSIHITLTIISLLSLPLVYLTAVRMRQLVFPVSWIQQSRMADVATIVEENVSGVRVVKAHAAEQHQINILAMAAERLRWAAVYLNDIRALYGPVIENLPRLATVVVLLYGGYLTIEGQVSIGALVAFSAYVIILQTPFRLLGVLLMMSQRAAASAQRIFEILDVEPQIVDRDDAVDLKETAGDVEFRNVSFAYENASNILDQLDLKLESGKVVALVGRTGSGKTSIAKLLARFYDVGQGSITIDGQDIRNLTIKSLRAKIGLVDDQSILFSTTIRENIAYGRPDASMEEIRKAAIAAGADRFIQELPQGYESVVGERGYTLSGGQRQRIAIARTLLTNPRILILDDATSSVDVTVESEIHDALKVLMKGRTTLIIAHRISTISLADEVLLLEDGHIVAQGTHKHLLETEPRYVEVLATARTKVIERKPSTIPPPPPTEERDEDMVPNIIQVIKGLD